MKARRGIFQRKCADVLREVAPQRGKQLRHRALWCVKGNDLRAGVYARIRPPAALHLDGDVENAGQHRFQLSLYRRVRHRKALPAAVARPVKGQRQAVVSLSHY